MQIPDNLKHILERVEKSEKEWKALYMAVWHYANHVDAQYINPKGGITIEGTLVPSIMQTTGTASVVLVDSQSETIRLGLPGAKSLFYEWNIKELYSILSSRDGEFTIGHLQPLFSLFEELLSETADSILSITTINTGKWSGIEQFFNLPDFNNILSTQELKELKLAKETRNCFIHNGSKIDDRWLIAYQDARGTTANAPKGGDLIDGLPKVFHQIEDWHNLVVRTSEKIRQQILAKP